MPTRACFFEVYPRVCGGTGLARPDIGPFFGLSPRVRGNQSRLLVPCHRVRSIPACAGEPAMNRSSVVSMPVYPRVCGGTASRLAKNRTGSGLSPRVRGNPAG